MDPVTYRLDGHVAVIELNQGENRFNPPFLEAFSTVLDTVEQQTEATCLVVTSTHEKIFSNGIDLEWLGPVLMGGDLATAKAFFYQLNGVFKRLVTYPLVTVAAISGHAFAGGAIICCAFDFRFMRSDRGFFCLPEVDLGIPLLPGMNALMQSAVPADVLRYMQLTGARLTGEQCEQYRIVQKACPQEQLMEETMAFARQVNKKRPIVAEMKRRLNQPILHALEVDDVAVIESGTYYFT